ncbi:MAG: hypothetical protein WA997_13055 [Anaerolineales bacterium]
MVNQPIFSLPIFSCPSSAHHKPIPKSMLREKNGEDLYIVG